MSERRALWALIALGAAARLLAFALQPSLHPDEYFQYLEPAWWHLHGYGWPAWEWAAGLRSWVLPAYHGAWMVLLGWLGITSGAALHALLQLHWAAASVLLIPAAHRAGGLFAAALCALLPELLYFAPHTLTEVPSAILVAWGYALWLQARAEGPDERRGALWAGALLSLAVCLRLPNAPLALVPAADLALRRRWPALGALVLAALGPLLLFGAVDQATWGRPFHSLLAYLDYNFLQGRASEHGVSPPLEYLWANWPALLALAAIALTRPREAWPTALPAALLVLLLSTQAHKEQRFLLACWPLFGMACGAALQRWRSRAAALGAALLVLALSGLDLWRRPPLDYTGRAGLYEAQAWAGGQPDATGLLVEDRFHLSGGFLMLGRNLPLESFHPALLRNPVFNYAAVKEGSAEERICAGAGMTRVRSFNGFSTWHR